MSSEYQSFIDSNPHVLTLFIEKTRSLLARGHRHVSQRMIWESLRYDGMTAPDGSSYNLNDHWLPHVVRHAISLHPEFRTVFHLRAAKADEEETPKTEPAFDIWDFQTLMNIA